MITIITCSPARGRSKECYWNYKRKGLGGEVKAVG